MTLKKRARKAMLLTALTPWFLWQASTAVADDADGGIGMAGKGAAATPAGSRIASTGWSPVASSALSRVRGGFTTSTGLELSLGIERLVSVNGTLISQTSVNIADVRAMSLAQAQSVKEAMSSVNIVQNGPANVVHQAERLAPGTFIQNAMNDQAISTRTTISAAVNSAGMLRELNFLSTIREANINALGGR